MKSISLILILLASMLVLEPCFAVDKFLSIKPIEGKDLTSREKRLIRKQLMLVASKQREFQLLLGELSTSKTSLRIYSMKIEISKTKNKKYSVESILFNEKDKRIVSKVKRYNIESHDLLRSSQVSLELLFKKYKEKIKKRVKNKSIKREKRIRELRKIASESEKKAATKQAQAKKQELKKSKALEIEKLTAIINKDVLQKNSQKTKFKSHVSVGIINQNIISRDIVQVRTTVQYLAAKYYGHKKFSHKSSWSFYLGGEYGKVISKIEEDVSNYYNLQSGIQKSFFDFDLNLSAGLDISSFAFVNVPIRGEDTKASSSNVIWFKYGMNKVFPFLGKYDLGIGLDYYKSLVSSLDYSPAFLNYGILNLENQFVEAKTGEFKFLASFAF